MDKTIRLILESLALVAIQILVFNHLHLFGGSAYVYVMILLLLPATISAKIVMPLCFLIGLIIDMFCGTYGIHAAAFTLAGFLRPFLANLFFSGDDIKGEPLITFRNQGMNFIWYALILITLHHFTLLMLEAFEWRLTGIVLLKTLISTAFTAVVILSFFILRTRQKEKS